MSDSYDVIVLGLGGMGSAAAAHLARRGARVLGLDRHPPAHARGSSHGHTRIIRTAYYEHPDYVPLADAAFDRWYELEQLTGRHLLTNASCLSVGPPHGELIAGVRDAVRRHGLSAGELTPGLLRAAYDRFRFPSDLVGIQESAAGFLYVEACVRAHLDLAAEHGADLRHGEPATAWAADRGGVTVTTAAGTYRAAKLVVAAGAWAAELLADIGVTLTVMRQVMLWFEPREPMGFCRDVFPVFIADTPGGAFYGLPMLDRRGVKVARHYAAPELAHPDAVDWNTSEADEAPVRAFLDAYLPGQFGRCADRQVCMYTLSPDRHFIVDLHPDHPNVAVACGFSGHGFKFASVLGEVLADLAMEGDTPHPVSLFRATRFE